MIALLKKADFVTVRDRFRAEKFQMSLGERDSTATITIGPEAPEITIGDALRDEDEPGAGIVWIVNKVDTDFITNTRTLSCNHVISMLKNFILFGEQTTATIANKPGATTVSAKDAMKYVLSFQRDFLLDNFAKGYESVTGAYTFNGDSVMDAMETISKTLEDCWWEYDLRTYPFKIHIRDRRQNPVETELRLTRNITSAKLTIDKSSMYTRIFPIGANDTKLPEKYIADATAEKTFGMICKTATESSKSTEAALREWAKNELKYNHDPAVTVTVSAIELSQETGEPLDHIMLGGVCQMPIPGLPEPIKERINKMSWPDKIADPNSITVTMANTRETASTIVASTIKSSSKSSRQSASNVSKGVLDIDLKQNGNNWTLWREDYQGVWKDVGTFSRAVTEWAVSATGGTIKVTAKPQGQSKDVKVRGGTAKRKGNKFTGPIEYSTDNKTWNDTGEKFSVDASEIYGLGWSAARASVRDKTYTYGKKEYSYFPTTSVTAANRLKWIYVAQPNKTVDGKINDTNRLRYYVTNTKNTAYIRYGTETGPIVAQTVHGAYDDGWGAARSSVRNKTYTYSSKEYNYFPTTSVTAANRLAWMQVAQPNETVDGGINDTNRYRYYVTNTKNTAYIRYGTATGPIVAQTVHGEYNNGWEAARSSMWNQTYTYGNKEYSYFPSASVAAADRLQWIYVARPNETVDGGINDTNRWRYYVTNTKNTAYIRFGSTTGAVVAQTVHGAYDDGWGAAMNSMWGKTYTYDSKTYEYFPTSSVALADRLQWIYVARPNETVDGGINDTNRWRYYVTAGSGKAYIRFGSTTGNIVAETSYSTGNASDIQLYANGTSDIVRTASQPTGTNPLTALATILKQAYLNQGGAGQWVTFPATINGGTGTKRYSINMG